MSELDWSQPLVENWWSQLPLAACRVSTSLAITLTDGFYITACPRVAAVAPPLALLAGILIGWWHPGFQTVFSESLGVMILAAILGMISAHLGAMFLAGFVVGDYFLAHTYWSYPGGLVENLMRVRVPLLIEYGLLGLLTVTIPMMTKALSSQIISQTEQDRQAQFWLTMSIQVAVTLVLIYLWTQAVPTLIRSVSTWQGASVPTEAMAPLLQWGGVLVAVSVIALLIRLVLEQVIAPQSENRVQPAQLETRIGLFLCPHKRGQA